MRISYLEHLSRYSENRRWLDYVGVPNIQLFVLRLRIMVTYGFSHLPLSEVLCKSLKNYLFWKVSNVSLLLYGRKLIWPELDFRWSKWSNNIIISSRELGYVGLFQMLIPNSKKTWLILCHGFCRQGESFLQSYCCFNFIVLFLYIHMSYVEDKWSNAGLSTLITSGLFDIHYFLFTLINVCTPWNRGFQYLQGFHSTVTLQSIVFENYIKCKYLKNILNIDVRNWDYEDHIIS